MSRSELAGAHSGAEGGTQAPVDRPQLVRARRQRLEAELGSAPFDAYLAVAPGNVDYAIGYRSVAGAVHGTSSIGALVSDGQSVVAGPMADAPSVLETGVDAAHYLAHGTFYFESSQGWPATIVSDRHADFVSATVAAFEVAGLTRATVGIDTKGLAEADRAALEAALPRATLVDAGSWLPGVRRVKLPEEVARLRAAAAATEEAIHDAVDAAAVGMNESELQHIVASGLVRGGLTPRFVVATVGSRTAYADTPACADQSVRPGDLLRFDVGGQLDGYWSDLGRTAVAGEPDALQRERYDAILAGELAQLEFARPGVTAKEVFDVAVAEVERNGLRPYRRHHCGHGIGLDVYEAPIIDGRTDVLLEPGMVFCFETPYYELGWGGMMVEDTLVITSDGCELLSTSDRSLRVAAR
jgi:Xaa-Pro aminopeptidase